VRSERKKDSVVNIRGRRSILSLGPQIVVLLLRKIMWRKTKHKQTNETTLSLSIIVSSLSLSAISFSHCSTSNTQHNTTLRFNNLSLTFVLNS